MPYAPRSTWLYLLGVIVTIYLTLSLYQINLPGLHYDEAFEAVPALQLLRGQSVTAFRNSGLVINGQLFPWMTQDYIGAINTYLAIPFIAVMGPTTAALRVMSILVGLVTLGLTYLLTAQLSGQRWPGLAAAALLAVDPTFIFWNRQGIFVTAVTAAIGLAAVLCWWHRWQSGGKRWSAAGAFCFGLGLYAKLLFVWLIAALIGAVILLNWRQLSSRHLFQQWRVEIGLIIGMFLFGCWPLLIYNLQTGGTFLNVSRNATTSYYGVNNLAFGPNLIERLNQFFVLLSGSHLWYLGTTISNPLPVLGFGAAMFVVLFLALSSLWPKSLPGRNSQQAQNAATIKIVLFPFVVIGLVIMASIGTVSALWITHFAVLMPWPAIAIALSGWWLSQFIIYNLRFMVYVLRGFLAIVMGLLLLTNFSSTVRYHTALSVSGGLSAHSDAVYDMSEWLASHAAGPVVAMDWGLAAPITYLTDGRVTPTEVFGYVWQPDQDLTLRLQNFIAQPETLYLWRAPDEIIFDRSPQFKALYRPLNLEETIEAAFYERSGRPILGVTRLVPKGSAANPPK
ncbi:MAG: glycosyltransferase family 39 protein [Anaerolineae bacterium]